MKYHAHIYWSDSDQRDRAMALRQSFADLGCVLGSVHNQAIGPHPLPMYQVNLDHTQREKVESLVQSKSLVALIHEDTGDDVRDHTLGAAWIGSTLALDIQWLKNYTENKHA